MVHYESPWLFEIKKNRKPYRFENISPLNDVVIIGGGIAGIMSAYYILKLTKKKVVLLESNRIASGATGHNAGQVIAYLEKPFNEIIDEYGHDLALEGQKDINSAWDLLQEIKEDLQIKTPLHIFEGLSGCKSTKPVYTHLVNRFLRPKVSHQNEFCFIADDCPFLQTIPSTFADLYSLVPRKIITDLLETKDEEYCVAFTAKKGCMNSALFCEEVTAKLLNLYKERFQVCENTQVQKIILGKNKAQLNLANAVIINTKHIVLCTNGFTSIEIENKAGKAINSKLHEALQGKIGFMKAYTFKDTKKPVAISYYNESNNEYFYLTRRPSSISNDDSHNLISIGGPEYLLPNKHVYSSKLIFPKTALNSIDKFIEETRINEYKEHYEHVFIWHGLMGYTKKGLRLIGPDKHNPTLLYNLGCNGIGILPSIFGGKKIAHFLNNEVKTESIFDPYF